MVRKEIGERELKRREGKKVNIGLSNFDMTCATAHIIY